MSGRVGFGADASDTTHTVAGYDDETSFSSTTGPGFVVKSHKTNPRGNREGNYSLSGYVLTLRYDNGNVVRRPFFFRDAAHQELWFEGASLLQNKK